MATDVKYMNPDNLKIVGLDIEEEGSPLYDERALWDPSEAMVRNIMVYGIQQPVIVRIEAGEYYVVDGRQRVKAARVAAQRQEAAGEHMVKVPCITVIGEDARVSGIMVSTNELRKDDDMLGKARKAARLLDLTGDKDTVALAFGVSSKTIDNYLKLLQASPEVHAAVADGVLSASVAIDLAGKSRSEQLSTLEKVTAEPSPSATNKGKKKVVKREDVTEVKEHAGAKKGWIRKALRTDAAKELNPEQRGILSWIIDGRAPQDSWLDLFILAAESEIQKHGDGESTSVAE
jgi:ParB family chromosome partitioning protein